MLHEKSCGAIVYRRFHGNIEILLIKHVNSGHWSFPKGHVELGETEEATALREIREETGISARLLEGFRIEEQYPLPNKSGVIKQVIYFLAEFTDQEIVYQKEELKAACLLPYEEAANRLTFEETKHILAKANSLLRQS